MTKGDAVMSIQKRKFNRQGAPAVIYAPLLTDLCIVPIDISGGGFKAVLEKEPSLDGTAA